MIQIPSSVSRHLAPLFPGIADTALLSALQGYMGEVVVDDPDNIRLIMARTGEYYYFGGDPAHPLAAQLVDKVPPGSYVVSFEPEWKALFSRVYGSRGKVQERYMLKKDMNALSLDYLAALFAQVPAGYRLEPITLTIAQSVYDQPWAHEYMGQFDSPQDFVTRGFGYALLQGEQTGCISTTFSIFDGGIEVGIATHPNHRRRGLATIAVARLVYEAKSRGLLANWDAANRTSLHLAQKLGYTLEGSYTLTVLEG